MPARYRLRPRLRRILPFLAALITWLYVAAALWYAFWQITQLIREGQEREAQTWARLPPLRLENLSSLQPVRQSRLLARVTSLSFSPSGRFLAAGSDATDVTVFDVVSNRRAAWFPGAGFYVLDVAFAPDEQTIASAEAGGAIRVWGLAEGGLLRAFQAHAADVNALAFSPDGALLASASSDASVLVWEWKAGRVLRSYRLNGVAAALAFSADGRFLAAGDLSGQVWLWRVLEDEPFCRWLHPGGVTDIRFQADSGLVYAAGGDSISSWNADDCAAGLSLTIPDREPVGKIALSPDGRLAVGAGGKWQMPRLWAWSLPDGLLVLAGSLPSTAEAVRDLMFTPDGRAFVTGSHDALIRWWGVK